MKLRHHSWAMFDVDESKYPKPCNFALWNGQGSREELKDLTPRQMSDVYIYSYHTVPEATAESNINPHQF